MSFVKSEIRDLSSVRLSDDEKLCAKLSVIFASTTEKTREVCATAILRARKAYVSFAHCTVHSAQRTASNTARCSCAHAPRHCYCASSRSEPKRIGSGVQAFVSSHCTRYASVRHANRRTTRWRGKSWNTPPRLEASTRSRVTTAAPVHNCSIILVRCARRLLLLSSPLESVVLMASPLQDSLLLLQDT